MGGERPLTDDEIHTARLLRRESKTIDQIAKMLGRSRAAVGEIVKGFTIHRAISNAQETVIIPDHVLADRDRRLAMQPLDLTALLMGDPVR